MKEKFINKIHSILNEVNVLIITLSCYNIIFFFYYNIFLTKRGKCFNYNIEMIQQGGRGHAQKVTRQV